MVDADGELGACETDLGEFTGDGLGEVEGRGGAGLGEAPCEAACPGQGGVEVALGVEAQFVGVVDGVELPARVSAERDDDGLGGAVLAFEPSDEGDAFLDGVEACGVVVDGVGEGARFACGVVDLSGCRLESVDARAQGA